MLKKTIMLDTMDSVKQFVSIASSKDYDIELHSGNYIVSGKSIVGIFSLDLTKPITMLAHCGMVAELSRQIEPFLYKE